MSRRIEILGPNDRIAASGSTELAATRACYTRILLANEPQRLIRNAEVEIRALSMDGSVWPLVLADSGAQNSDGCSAYTWYARYAPAALAKRKSRLAGLASRVTGLPMEMLLAAGAIDRLVYVNNWLLTTNPHHELDAAALAAVTSELIAQWPDRAVVFRSVNPSLDRRGFDALQSAGYRFVRSRHVYLVDTRDPAVAKRNNVGADLAKLEHTHYELVGDPERLARWTDRMADLYHEVYVGKYVHHNPQFTEEFFSQTLSRRALHYVGFVHDGRLDAMIGYLESEGVLWSILIGYDVAAERKAGLYRLVIALLLREARDRGLVLNLSSGVGEFKMLRGGRAVDEFDAVYDAHLPMRRRLPWRALALASNRRLIDPSILAGR